MSSSLHQLSQNENDVQIVYSKTWDDWNDKDVDKFAIRELTLSAVATSTIPLNATMTAVPLVIGADGTPVIDHTATCKAIALPGEASNAPISISIVANDPEKPIRHLAGIRIQARVTPHNNEPLAPDQTISLTDIKAAVSGYYDITDDKYEQYYNCL